MDYKKYYHEVYTQCGTILTNSLSSKQSSELGKVHAFLDDFLLWVQILDRRKESCLFRAAHKELQVGLVSLVFGGYRHAFMSLRFVLERSLVAVKLSTDIIGLEHWLKYNRDINWASIIDEAQGVFSHEFVDAFMPALHDDSKHICGIAQTVYKKCSEYIHGNYATLEVYPLAFSEDKFALWLDAFDSIKHCIAFALLMRYWNELTEDEKIKIESMIVEEFAHMGNIRSVVSYR